MTDGVERTGPGSGTARFEALSALSQEMALVGEEREIYGVVLDVAHRVLEFLNCAILLMDSETGELVMVAERGYAAETRGIRLPLGTGRGISAWVAEHGQRLYVPDVRKEERYIRGVDEARSELAVPIQIQGRTLGVLDVESHEVDAFDDDDAMLLQGLASQMALAIELLRAREELERMSVTDPLTGVYNRRFLERLLPGEKERAERFDHPIGLIMFDLDDFKEVNDQFGHHRGDQVLKAFAEALSDSVRKIDPVVRYGGDEFLVVLLETDERGVLAAGERIAGEVVERLNASTAVGETWRVSISMGCAVRMPGEDLDLKLREADTDMYRRKGLRTTRPPLAG
ncbi:MAG TPA: sensor domain-containing diguanylate cyclase [Gemmatimonadota bacterium]|nr:sensor domain-containing diguanylate cyclase [Gemmatimonadota bacterium]